MLPIAPPPHVSFRTPLALVEHADRPGSSTLFFTAFLQNHADPAKHPQIGGYAGMFATELELVLTQRGNENGGDHPEAKADRS